MTQKTALSVQSLACHGKCSLTEALPIISSDGISLSVLPTVLLSTHTGGFGIPVKADIAEFFEDALKHFQKEKIFFDGIYTGYFGSIDQIFTFTNLIENLKKKSSVVLVDPVLGDNGKLFNGISESFVGAMSKLCKSADIITPNLTEAYLLCGEKFREETTIDDVIKLSVKLYNLTNAFVIITGIENKRKISVSMFDGEKIKFLNSRKIGVSFHGTGDAFTSVVFAEILNGNTVYKSVRKAMDFVSKAIKKTNGNERDGLKFEKLLSL